jgi:hypothetical protein
MAEAAPAPAPDKPTFAAEPTSLLNQPPPADPPKDGEPPKDPAPKDGEKPPEKPPEAPPVIDLAAVKLPEGITADDDASKAAMKSASEILADDKLPPQERMQKLIDVYGGLAKAAADSNGKAWNDLQDQWQTEVKADPTIGGDKLVPTQQMISKAIDTLGPDSAKAFRSALDFTGAGNNPAIIKGLAAFAKLAVEGGHVTGAPPKVAPTTAQEFFPNSPEMK